MRPGGGKAKGSAYERAVAEVLTKAYYPDGDGLFQRILPQPIPKKGEVRGDLKALKYRTDFPITRYEGQDLSRYLVFDNSWPFVVECKSYKEVKPFFCGLYAKETALFDWMDQAAEVADIEKHTPLVVFKIFRSEHIAMLRTTDFSRLMDMFGVCKAKRFRLTMLVEGNETKGMTMLLLTDFLSWIDWGVYKVGGCRYIRSLIGKEPK